MPELPKKLKAKLVSREADNALRHLGRQSDLVDFSSNDYLGFARKNELTGKAEMLLSNYTDSNGATGSRLLSGNQPIHETLEAFLESYFNVDGALLFNSGYDANVGFFSSVPQRGDFILYDELVHASIRDGITMSNAKAYKFKHNDIQDLNNKLENLSGEIYLVTESVFSMDGDTPDLKELADFCQEKGLHLVIDEAHALGVFERGLVHRQRLENKVFARIVTFGKAMGCHGAAILGTGDLKTYLVNFARSFIYTTALSPHSVALILASFQWLKTEKGQTTIESLRQNIGYFKEQLAQYGLEHIFLPSESAIQIAVIGGNSETKQVALKMQEAGFDVRPILSPTVAVGKERIRICLHAFNTQEQIMTVLALIQQYHG